MAKKRTFADEAKTIMNKYKPRLGENFDKGDTLALEAMNQELEDLKRRQEVSRVTKLIEDGDENVFQGALQGEQQGIERQFGGGLPSQEFTEDDLLNLGQQTLSQQGVPAYRCGGKLRLHQGGGQLLADQLQFQRDSIQTDQRQRRIDPFIQAQQIQEGERPLFQSPDSSRSKPFGDAELLQRLKPQSNIPSVPLPQPRIDTSSGRQPVPLPQPDLSGELRFATGGKLPQYQGEGPFSNSLNAYYQNTYGNDYDRLVAEGIVSGPNSPYGNVRPLEYQESTAQQQGAGNRGTRTGFFDPTYSDEAILGTVDPNAYTFGTGQDPSASPFAQEQAGIYGQPGGFETQANPDVVPSPDSPFPQVQGPSRFNQWWQGLAAQQGDPYQSRVPWWGAAATGIGSLIANRAIDFDEDQYEAQRVSPNLVNFGREREQIQRERDRAQSMIRRSARSRGSQAGLTENIIAGATGTQRIAGEQFSKSLQNEANINAQIRNQASQINARERARANTLNVQAARENQLINEQRRASKIQDVFGAATGYGRDRMAASKFDVMAQILGGPNFQYQTGEGDTPLNRLLGFNPPAQAGFVDTGDTAATAGAQAPGTDANQNWTQNRGVQMLMKMFPGLGMEDITEMYQNFIGG